MARHDFYICPKPCDKQHCDFCLGKLAMCKTCGGLGRSLTRDCPEVKMTDYQLNRVYDGDLDYRSGTWVRI